MVFTFSCFFVFFSSMRQLLKTHPRAGEATTRPTKTAAGAKVPMRAAQRAIATLGLSASLALGPMSPVGIDLDRRALALRAPRLDPHSRYAPRSFARLPWRTRAPPSRRFVLKVTTTSWSDRVGF